MSTRISMVYEGTQITQGDGPAKPGSTYIDVAGDLLSFDYLDNADGKVDDLQISLMNRKNLWQAGWLPQKGAKISASILPAFGGGEVVCGDMWVDEVEVGGPPSVATIKAVSVPIGETIRGTRKTRAWEGTTFQAISDEIAKGAGLKPSYQGDQVEIERADQHEESDLAFLSRLGEDFGFVVKVGRGKLVVYDQEILEDADPVAVVDVAKGDGMVTNWRVRSKTRGVYQSARVMYRNPIRKLLAEALKEHPAKDPKEPVFVPRTVRARHRRLTAAQKKAREKALDERAKKTYDRKHAAYLDTLMRQAREEERRAKEGQEVEVDDKEFMFTPNGAPVVGSVLEITKRVKDEAEAKRVAERMLRNANRDEVTLSLDLIGDAVMRAGVNIVLTGAGKFSGKYHIDQARHSVRGSGYTTSVAAHRVLSYR